MIDISSKYPSLRSAAAGSNVNRSAGKSAPENTSVYVLPAKSVPGSTRYTSWRTGASNCQGPTRATSVSFVLRCTAFGVTPPAHVGSSTLLRR